MARQKKTPQEQRVERVTPPTGTVAPVQHQDLRASALVNSAKQVAPVQGGVIHTPAATGVANPAQKAGHNSAALLTNTQPPKTEEPGSSGPGGGFPEGSCPGIAITAPISVSDTTCGAGNDCTLRPSTDRIYEVTIPSPGTWVFSLCPTTPIWDSFMYLGSTCCSSDLGADDDTCTAPAFGTSQITATLAAGVYYVDVEAFGSTVCAAYTLDIALGAGPCDVVCDPTKIPENEPDCFDNYVDATNGGCNSSPPVFTDIVCGDEICGEAGTFISPLGSTRDTDWYRVTLTAATQVTWCATAEFPVLVGIVNNFGVDSCAGVTAFLTSATGTPCVEACASACLQAGTWYLFVAPSAFTGVPCGSEYNASLVCAECPGAPGNDLCDDATDIPGPYPQSVNGDTSSATVDAPPICQGNTPTAPGVWYTVTGTGNTMTATTCNAVTQYDTRISVFCGEDCDNLVCVGHNDDGGVGCELPSGAPFESRVIWCSTLGQTYWVLVHGFVAGSFGVFQLDILDDGAPCSPAALCAPCNVVCDPDKILENEPDCFDGYVDATNGGCNSTPNVFTDIVCGDEICGEAGTFISPLGNTRDTDWYRVTLTEATEVTWCATAEFPLLIGVVNNFGIDSCAGVTAFLVSATANECIEACVTTCLTPGTWYLFIAPSVFAGVPCGKEYNASLTCQPCPCADGFCCKGDADNSGDLTGLDIQGIVNAHLGAPGNECGSQGFCAADVDDDGFLTSADIPLFVTALLTKSPCPTFPDHCEDAVLVGVPSVTPGDTSGADVDGPTCGGGGAVGSPSLWYNLLGTGNTITVTTCDASPTTGYDTKLSVFCGPCDNLVCIGGNDDGGTPDCQIPAGPNWKSRFSWCSAPGQSYYVIVHGFATGNFGPFNLIVSDDGAACGPPASCLGPCNPDAGDCCLAHAGVGCNQPACCAAICAADPFCCDTNWDGLCATAAQGNPDCTCVAPECVDCVDNEGEPVCFDNYVDATNGGCNSTPTVFSPIACGSTICGTAGTFTSPLGATRDTDWYEITLTEDTLVTWSATAEFPVLIFILNGVCPPTAIGPAGVADPCVPVTLQQCLAAGVYRLFIAPSGFTGVTCGAQYTATVACEPCTPPPSPCDDPNAGDCCVAHPTPGCNIPDCCNAICGNDPFCCNNQWDGICANAANANPLCNCGGGGPPPNDLCPAAIALTQGTPVNGTTVGSTNDGTAPCGASATSPDVWYSITAAPGTLAVVSTCGGTGLDTVLSSHDACGGPSVVCLDDSCGLQTTITATVPASGTVLIRVAGFGGGVGAFTIVWQ